MESGPAPVAVSAVSATGLSRGRCLSAGPGTASPPPPDWSAVQGPPANYTSPRSVAASLGAGL